MDWAEDSLGATSLGAADFPDQSMGTLLNRIVPPLQTPYRIWDITDPEAPVAVPFFVYNTKLHEGNPFQRRDPLAPFDYRDAMLLAMPDPAQEGHYVINWLMETTSAYVDTVHALPAGGERWWGYTLKPFTAGDTFSFTVNAPRVDNRQAGNELSRVRVVPNPYLAAAEWEPRPIKGNRGERKIQFTHLPPTATVRVYTERGELVQTLHHQAPAWDGSLDWNLKSSAGLDVAYGMYFYHVDSPAGEKTGKFALIK
jgi:hypothetical protein